MSKPFVCIYADVDDHVNVVQVFVQALMRVMVFKTYRDAELAGVLKPYNLI